MACRSVKRSYICFLIFSNPECSHSRLYLSSYVPRIYLLNRLFTNQLLSQMVCVLGCHHGQRCQYGYMPRSAVDIETEDRSTFFFHRYRGGPYSRWFKARSLHLFLWLSCWRDTKRSVSEIHSSRAVGTRGPWNCGWRFTANWRDWLWIIVVEPDPAVTSQNNRLEYPRLCFVE